MNSMNCQRAAGSLREGIPFWNKNTPHQQIPLTGWKCLYNGRRVGEYLS